jgi:hypothetical protein
LRKYQDLTYHSQHTHLNTIIHIRSTPLVKKQPQVAIIAVPRDQVSSVAKMGCMNIRALCKPLDISLTQPAFA